MAAIYGAAKVCFTEPQCAMSCIAFAKVNKTFLYTQKLGVPVLCVAKLRRNPCRRIASPERILFTALSRGVIVTAYPKPSTWPRRNVSWLVIPGEEAHHILHICPRTMASPLLHPNTFAKAPIFDSGPLARNRASGCALVLACSRAASGR